MFDCDFVPIPKQILSIKMKLMEFRILVLTLRFTFKAKNKKTYLASNKKWQCLSIKNNQREENEMTIDQA